MSLYTWPLKKTTPSTDDGAPHGLDNQHLEVSAIEVSHVGTCAARKRRGFHTSALFQCPLRDVAPNLMSSLGHGHERSATMCVANAFQRCQWSHLRDQLGNLGYGNEQSEPLCATTAFLSCQLDHSKELRRVVGPRQRRSAPQSRWTPLRDLRYAGRRQKHQKSGRIPSSSTNGVSKRSLPHHWDENIVQEHDQEEHEIRSWRITQIASTICSRACGTGTSAAGRCTAARAPVA